jgi:P-type E1-E2 ATPase
LIRLDIPGWGTSELKHLVLDLNGTLAMDGSLIPGVDSRVRSLSSHLTVHLATADTHGRAEDMSRALGVQLVRITPNDEARQKEALVERLGSGQVVAIGNGANDARMLQVAALGIAVLGREGLATSALRSADLVAGGVEDALDMLRLPQRLVATLRS